MKSDSLEEVAEDTGGATAQEGEEDATAQASVEVVGAREDDRDGFEEKVHDAVDEGHVERDDRQHRLLEEHDERFQDGPLEDCLNAAFLLLVEVGMVAVVAGLFAKTLRFGGHQDGEVRFREEENDADAAGTSEDREDPEDPPEGCTGDLHESGADRGEGGSRCEGEGGQTAESSRDGSAPTLTEGHERKDGHGVSTAVRTPQIGDDTAGVGERSGGEASAEEPEHDERPDVGREGASDLEACEWISIRQLSVE